MSVYPNVATGCDSAATPTAGSPLEPADIAAEPAATVLDRFDRARQAALDNGAGWGDATRAAVEATR